MLVSHVPPVLDAPSMRANKTQGRIAVVRHQLGPGKGGECGEVVGQALLHLHLERTVLGISGGIAMHDDTGVDVAVGELLERLGCIKSGGAVTIGAVSDLIDLAQTELVQIQLGDRKEETAAAHITGADNDLVWEFVLQAEVEVISFLRALRAQHRVQSAAQAGLQSTRLQLRGRKKTHSQLRWERIAQRKGS